jgi:hypothetical protein
VQVLDRDAVRTGSLETLKLYSEDHEPLIMLLWHGLAMGLLMPGLATVHHTPYAVWACVVFLPIALLPFVALGVRRLAPPRWQWCDHLLVGVMVVDATCVCVVWAIHPFAILDRFA